MTTTPPQPAWQPLSRLDAQYRRNLAALAARDPALAARVDGARPTAAHVIAALPDRILLGRDNGAGVVEPLPNPVPPAYARDVAAKLFPQGKFTEPVLIAGLDQGWILDALHRLEVASPLPMHRPPLYVLAKDLGRLWVVLHFQDWEKLLADERVVLFVGPDAADQYRLTLEANAALPLPRLALTIDHDLWPAGQSADAVAQRIRGYWEAQLRAAHQRLATHPLAPAADAFQPGRRLRVLGITSRFTTFLQHSMRDWLAGFRQLGHETRLVIESADHEVMTNVTHLKAVAEFRPDLIVLIDHHRAEFGNFAPDVPCVMWVQDFLPNLLSSKAGAAQGPLDFCLGFGRHYFAREYGYPAERFLPSPIGINDARFAGVALSPADEARFACDVSYVSHASATAEDLMAREAAPAAPGVRAFLYDVFEELRAHYACGGGVVGRPAMMRLMTAALDRRATAMAKDDFDRACAFFTHTIGNALFRHQSLEWLSDLGVDLHLYGRGWEGHPRLRRHAKGPADNHADLGRIYRATRVNLQVTPHGVVHQRLLDGLSAGAFFLLRYMDGDAVGAPHLELFRYCQAHGVRTEQQLTAATATDPALATLLRRIDVLEGYAELPREYGVLQVNQTHADSDFFVAAASVWPEYDQVTFDSKPQLEQRLRHFLARPDERQRLAAAMRGPVVERASYKAISRRVLAMVGDALAERSGATAEPLRLTA